mmetsp:Transcript_29901/g.72231  ORF Transcript_29901/g.72231 Transcript_29901/m.72231 type:complete len:92 (+) Transcript_29901:65-340(+)
MTIRPAGPTPPPPLDRTLHAKSENVRPPRLETPYPPPGTVETFPSPMDAMETIPQYKGRSNFVVRLCDEQQDGRSHRSDRNKTIINLAANR